MAALADGPTEQLLRVGVNGIQVAAITGDRFVAEALPALPGRARYRVMQLEASIGEVAVRMRALGLAGSDRTNAAALVTHCPSAGSSRPSGSMKTMPFIGRPVKSISRTCGRLSQSMIEQTRLPSTNW